MLISTYQTIATPIEAEFKDKGSRFIAFAYPVQTTEEVKAHVDVLREQHNKARHWCYAYRIGINGMRFRVNDDGEPSGSAGRPILGQIDSAELTDVLVVVVRYFGGTLLGVPGLINAYKNATAAALAQARVLEKNVEKTVFLRCDYPYLNNVIRIAKQYQAKITQQDLQLDCRLSVNIPLVNYEACVTAWRQTWVIEVITKTEASLE